MKMRYNIVAASLLLHAAIASPAVVNKRSGFSQGQPISSDGKGAAILGTFSPAQPHFQAVVLL